MGVAKDVVAAISNLAYWMAKERSEDSLRELRKLKELLPEPAREEAEEIFDAMEMFIKEGQFDDAWEQYEVLADVVVKYIEDPPLKWNRKDSPLETKNHELGAFPQFAHFYEIKLNGGTVEFVLSPDQIGYLEKYVTSYEELINEIKDYIRRERGVDVISSYVLKCVDAETGEIVENPTGRKVKVYFLMPPKRLFHGTHPDNVQKITEEGIIARPVEEVYPTMDIFIRELKKMGIEKILCTTGSFVDATRYGKAVIELKPEGLTLIPFVHYGDIEWDSPENIPPENIVDVWIYSGGSWKSTKTGKSYKESDLYEAKNKVEELDPPLTTWLPEETYEGYEKSAKIVGETKSRYAREVLEGRRTPVEPPNGIRARERAEKIAKPKERKAEWEKIIEEAEKQVEADWERTIREAEKPTEASWEKILRELEGEE